MPLNNPALYDSALSAIAASNGAWIFDKVPGNYSGELSVAQAIATEIDAQIPTIVSGITISQRQLLESIVKSIMIDRKGTSISAATYLEIAQAVAAIFTEFATNLQNLDQGSVNNPMIANLDANGFAITNFSNAKSTINLALAADGLQSFPATVLTGLLPSKIYQAELQFEIGLTKDADHTVNGSVDFTVQVSITTDIAGIATVVLNTVPVPNISYLPVGLGGSSAFVIPSVNGFTVQAQRPAGVACHAWFYVYWVRIKDVT